MRGRIHLSESDISEEHLNRASVWLWGNTTVWRLNESELELDTSYSISDEEEMIEAIVNAFTESDIDVYKKPTELVDWISADVLAAIDWTVDPPVLFSTRIWDRQVVITADEIRIYMPPLYRSGAKAPTIMHN